MVTSVCAKLRLGTATAGEATTCVGDSSGDGHDEPVDGWSVDMVGPWLRHKGEVASSTPPTVRDDDEGSLVCTAIAAAVGRVGAARATSSRAAASEVMEPVGASTTRRAVTRMGPPTEPAGVASAGIGALTAGRGASADMGALGSGATVAGMGALVPGAREMEGSDGKGSESFFASQKALVRRTGMPARRLPSPMPSEAFSVLSALLTTATVLEHASELPGRPVTLAAVPHDARPAASCDTGGADAVRANRRSCRRFSCTFQNGRLNVRRIRLAPVA
mmetsp:Transcript_11974/g.35274  ORF Transcript_11974/g.35274 Transcript_11974/m.35274 type:complete len:277 (+) Transcript_11974:380-1210(+)